MKKQRADEDEAIPNQDGVVASETAQEDAFVGPPAPVTEELSVGPPLLDLPAPELAPSQLPPALEAPARVAQPPVAQVAFFAGPEMEERLRRLEQTLSDIKEIEKRLAARAAGELLSDAPPVKSEASSLLSGAASLLEVGRWLLPAGLAGPGAPPTPGSLADLLADLRAMYLMLVDPRYAMTWLGRLGIPGFLVLFLLPELWMPAYTYVKLLGPWVLWLYVSVGQLVTGFALFRVLTVEARRYRETAPDLPPSLRL